MMAGAAGRRRGAVGGERGLRLQFQLRGHDRGVGDGKLLEAGTPLGEGVLLLRRCPARRARALSRVPARVRVQARGDIQPKEILGKNISWLVRLADGEPRYFNGYVTRFAEAGEGGRRVR